MLLISALPCIVCGSRAWRRDGVRAAGVPPRSNCSGPNRRGLRTTRPGCPALLAGRGVEGRGISRMRAERGDGVRRLLCDSESVAAGLGDSAVAERKESASRRCASNAGFSKGAVAGVAAGPAPRAAPESRPRRRRALPSPSLPPVPALPRTERVWPATAATDARWAFPGLGREVAGGVPVERPLASAIPALDGCCCHDTVRRPARVALSRAARRRRPRARHPPATPQNKHVATITAATMPPSRAGCDVTPPSSPPPALAIVPLVAVGVAPPPPPLPSAPAT